MTVSAMVSDDGYHGFDDEVDDGDGEIMIPVSPESGLCCQNFPA